MNVFPSQYYLWTLIDQAEGWELFLYRDRIDARVICAPAKPEVLWLGSAGMSWRLV